MSNSHFKLFTGFIHWLTRLVNIEQHESKALAWSFLYFFSLLCSYYIVRPMRDEMGIAGGVENLQWLFSGTFILMLAAVPLFGWVSSRFPRKQFLPYVYWFFIANLLVFIILFKSNITHAYVARAFFIWASVFNLFIVSVFWSFMTDIFNNEQAKRMFGVIAAGGTTGAIVGPTLTASLAIPIGPINLLFISALLLGFATICIRQLVNWSETQKTQPSTETTQQLNNTNSDKAMGGGLFAGVVLVWRSPYLLGICLLMLLYASLSTFLYFQQAQIIKDNFADSAQRTAVFAAIDLSVNILTILLQVFFTSRLIKWLGLSWTLALIPLMLAVGFLALGFAPVLGVLITVQIIRRAGNYAIMRPAREMLYVVLDREEKYKAKNFIDTVVYRGGDAVSAWIYTGMRSLGMGIAGIAWIAAPLAIVWAWLAYVLGKKQATLEKQKSKK